jgi:RsiW-degrading membrane proteinase PrsW (M82 family)
MSYVSYGVMLNEIRVLEKNPNLEIIRTYLYLKQENYKLFNREVMGLDSKLPFANYLKAHIYLNDNTTLAKKYLLTEIQNKVFVNRALDIYLILASPKELLQLTNSHEIKQHISHKHLAHIAQVNSNYLSFFYHKMMDSNNIQNWISFFGALCVFLVWVYYFINLDIFNPNGIKVPILVLAMGCGAVFLVFLIDDLIGKYLPDESNQFLYYTIKVGMVEEFVKFLPFGVLLLFYRKIDEPIDYIIFMSLSALSFAFVENILYFNRYGIDILRARGLMFAQGHLIFSGVIAYGLILQKFRYKNWNFALTLFLSYLLASLLHGLYDTFCMMEFRLFFFLFYVIALYVWGIFINNALNNSSFYNLDKIKKLQNLNFLVPIFMFGIALLDFILVGFSIGEREAYENLSKGMLSNIYYIFLTSIILSKFDIINGYWEKIRLPKSLTQVFFPTKESSITFLGKEIELVCNRHNLELGRFTPVAGKIISRKIVRDNKEWFLVKLNWTLSIDTHVNHHLLIRFRDGSVDLDLDSYVAAEVALIKLEEDFNNLEYSLKPRGLGFGFVNKKHQ